MFYRLTDLNYAVPCSMNEIADFKTGLTKKIARDQFGDVVVSTVFLGIEHGTDSWGHPYLFETMIFKNTQDDYMRRYVNYKDAMEGHKEAVLKVKKELNIVDVIEKVIIHDPIGRKGICLRS